MKILFDLHTHTTYSHAPIGTHGKGTIAQNVTSALGKGIGVGITDHGPGHNFYGTRPGDYRSIRQEIAAENKKAGRTVALCGVEANVIGADGRTDLDMIPGPLDVVLMGYHKGVLPNDKQSRRLLFPCTFNKEKAGPILTDAIIAAFSRYPIDVLTHPGEYVAIDMERVARAAVKYGVALELNNRHHMSKKDLQIAIDCGAFFVLSSDAHYPERVGTVESAAELVNTMKINPERIVNSDAYSFDNGLRLDRLKSFAHGLLPLSTSLCFEDFVD